MKKASVRLCLLTATVLCCALTSSAQINYPTRASNASGSRRQVAAPTNVAPVTRPATPPRVTQGGIGSSTTAVTSTRRDCDSGDSGYSPGYSYGPGGFPVYPGPDKPLPPQGSYYANPYGYYNNYNPYNPYGFYNNTGYYDTGYYTNSTAVPGGYYNGNYYYNNSFHSGSPPPTAETFPSFQPYNGAGR